MTKKFCLMTFTSAIIITFLASCVSGPPSEPPMELLKSNDHVALEAWYKKKATYFRAQADGMRRMVIEYEQLAHFPDLSNKGAEQEMVRHCQNLVEGYSKLAEEADTLAKLHRDHQANQ